MQKNDTINPREKILFIKLKDFFCSLFIVTFAFADAGAAMVASSRSATAVAGDHVRTGGQSNATTTVRAKQPVVLPRNTTNTADGTRGANRVAVQRTAVTPNRAVRVATFARTKNIITDASNAIVRRALGLGRSAKSQISGVNTVKNSTSARSATTTGASRARATAVFSDVSKLGAEYNTCREAYNTCMDQFCASANDTYRRCYCSNTFRDLRDKEDALDAATTMLAQFESSNLDAVNRTAEEVNAMYSATEGELAIKRDTSAAASLLSNVEDLLSGRKKPADVPAANNTVTSLTGLSVDFSADLGDIWGNSSDTLFADTAVTDEQSSFEGMELYNNAHAQCLQVIGSSCNTSAIRNMAKSAYNILITQDCNAYHKKLDTKTEQIKTTVRTAEKYLREARLEEYRTHNSADINECMDKVETAMTQSTACGTDYVKCLDYSGVYINSSSGEPIYSARLFKLNEMIQLDGSGDVLTQNPEFNQFLDSKRMYANTALDSCRDVADTVWDEFKRNALIKISQAQDEKIEEVKMSCVQTMKDCYDTQSGALKSFDDSTVQASGALTARASRDMCEQKVLACATLYGDNDGCDIDVKTNKVTAKGKGKCGLQSLLNFVSSVDNTRIAEGCSVGVQNYLKQLCTPVTGGDGYPWNCRLLDLGDADNMLWEYKDNPKTVTDMVVKYTFDNCGTGENTVNDIEQNVRVAIELELQNIRLQLSDLMENKCEDGGGVWMDNSYEATQGGLSNGDIIESFYNTVYGKTYNEIRNVADSWGKCLKNTVKASCALADESTGSNGYATYDETSGVCKFTKEYYKYQCELANGIVDDDNRCYIYIQDNTTVEIRRVL